MQWNPFNPSELAVGLEDGSVKIWRIESDFFNQGSQEDVGEDSRKLADLQPKLTLKVASGDRVTQIRYTQSLFYP